MPKKRSNKNEELIPPGTVDLRRDLVPAIRYLLTKGVSEQFQKSCVRIGAFNPYSGGMKAHLVGGLRIDVHAVLKLGTVELRRHVKLMKHVNKLRSGTFPAVLHEQQLKDGRVFIITEQCRKYVIALDKVFREETKSVEFKRILNKVFESLSEIHAVSRTSAPSLATLPTTPEPFMKRIRSRLKMIIKADPELKALLNRGGTVFNEPCPPVNVLLKRANAICARVAKAIRPTLVHGDPHLGNIMVRRNGPTAYRVRLIDPNPEIGFSQPLYDVGKLLHWAEPVGWAKANPSVCRSNFKVSPQTKQWSLSASVRGTSAAAERRRRWVEASVRIFAEKYRSHYRDDFTKILAVAIASSHIGFAALLVKPKDKHARRFVLAHGLKHLKTVAE